MRGNSKFGAFPVQLPLETGGARSDDDDRVDERWTETPTQSALELSQAPSSGPVVPRPVQKL